jgi:DNA polymerase/3'-5' exonuclease PolX
MPPYHAPPPPPTAAETETKQEEADKLAKEEETDKLKEPDMHELLTEFAEITHSYNNNEFTKKYRDYQTDQNRITELKRYIEIIKALKSKGDYNVSLGKDIKQSIIDYITKGTVQSLNYINKKTYQENNDIPI